MDYATAMLQLAAAHKDAVGSPRIPSVAELMAIAEQVSVTPSPGSNLILYSGDLGDIRAFQVADELAKDPTRNLAIIDHTDGGRFVGSKEFSAALENALDADPSQMIKEAGLR